jgi:predicted ATPase
MIILLGSHGTGKTSLLSELKRLRPDLYTTDGFSRPIHSALSQIPENISPRSEQILINELSQWNWKNNLNNKMYVSSRSIIDCCVYSKVLGWRDLGDEVLQFYKDNIPVNVKYFYIPIEFPIEDDGVRFMDKNFQIQIDVYLREFIRLNNLSTITLSGTLSERLFTLLTNI